MRLTSACIGLQINDISLEVRSETSNMRERERELVAEDGSENPGACTGVVRTHSRDTALDERATWARSGLEMILYIVSFVRLGMGTFVTTTLSGVLAHGV
jgi:hypothetical protein